MRIMHREERIKRRKIAFCGLGSIGTRHLKNLRTVLDERGETYSIDWISTAATVPANTAENINKQNQEGIRKRFSYEDEIDHDYDIIFVTNPTSKHCKTIEKYQWYTKSLFIEKPLFAFPDERLKEVNPDCLFYVACPVRYKRVVQYVKNHINPEEVLSAMTVCSSYLPEWRKGTDYRKGYSAIKDMGGGVSLDLIHELDYLSYLLGTVKNIYNIRDQVSDLELDSDDVSVYIAKLDKAVVQVYLDYFGRKDIRTLTLFCKEDTVLVDLLGNTVEYLSTGEKIELPEERDDFQKRELRYFLDIIDGKQPNTNDVNRAYQTLKNSFGNV